MKKTEKETSRLKITNVRETVDKRQISVSEAGRLGGNATLRNQGTDFFREIGRRGGKRTSRLYGQLMREHGKRGGRPRRPALDQR